MHKLLGISEDIHINVRLAEKLGEGYFGIVYKGYNPLGHKYALKVYKHYPGESAGSASAVECKNLYYRSVNFFLENLADKAELLSQSPIFLSPLIVSDELDIGKGEDIAKWVDYFRIFVENGKAKGYISPIFEGITLKNLREEIKERRLTEEERGFVDAACLAYAKGTEYLHSNGLLFIDHNAGNIIVDRRTSTAKLCDLESITSEEEIQRIEDHPARYIHTPDFTSSEQRRKRNPTRKGDLESAARLIFYAYNGKSFEDRPLESDVADLPLPLQQVIRDIFYNKDRGIEARDLANAMEKIVYPITEIGRASCRERV
jgi:serine/threonine protein kinase